MSSSRLSLSSASSSATVVELACFRHVDKTKTVVSASHQAQMLSMRHNLSYQASVEIDNLEWLRAEFGEGFCTSLAKQVRILLNKEFGKLRVHRYRGIYVIRHRSVEGLISSLLRAQFHAHQFDLPLVNNSGEIPISKSVTLTWGVGRTTTEAEVERVRRRRQKFKR